MGGLGPSEGFGRVGVGRLVGEPADGGHGETEGERRRSRCGAYNDSRTGESHEAEGRDPRGRGRRHLAAGVLMTDGR